MGFKLFLEQERAKDKPKEYSEAELEQRQSKKTDAIKKIGNNIQKLKNNVSRDLSSDDEKTQLTALAIALINATKERIGNDKSAEGLRKDEEGNEVRGDKHYGVTGFRKEHIKFSDGKAIIDYVGKSGVEQHKEVSDERIVKSLKKFCDKNDGYVFTTSKGLKINSAQVNRYLGDYDVSAKDLRGYGANELIINSLKGKTTPSDEKERKKLFLDVAKKVADKLGHSPTMLRNSYLLPNLEDMYIKSGKIKKI